MIINCNPNKTELICFNVKREEKSDLPLSLRLGGDDIMFVDKTKVLGVVFDKDLKFKEHSAMVYRKLCFRWISVCKYSNRNWPLGVLSASHGTAYQVDLSVPFVLRKSHMDEDKQHG